MTTKPLKLIPEPLTSHRTSKPCNFTGILVPPDVLHDILSDYNSGMARYALHLKYELPRDVIASILAKEKPKNDGKLHFAAFEGSPYFSLEDALNDFLDEVGPISIVHMTQSYIATGKHQDETCLAVTLFYRHGSAT